MILKKTSKLGLTIFCFAIFSFPFSIVFAQSPNTWTQKASFPGIARTAAVAFTIGSKGYVGTGQDSSLNLLNDFWEYDAGTNTWTQLANYGGSARRGAVGFCIGTKGFIGTGHDGTNNLLDFWEYDPSLNSWLQKRSMGTNLTTPRRDATSFSLAGKGYVVSGYDGTVDHTRECWEFDGDSTWVKRADLGNGGSPLTIARRWAVSFTIDSSGYLGCGFNFSQDWKRDFWKYNLLANTWTQMANFGGTARSNAVAFAANHRGFIGTGNDLVYRNDFWQYDPLTNVWIQIADYGGGLITSGIGFSVNESGYTGLGRDSVSFRNDFWQYAPDSTISVNDIDDEGFGISVFPNPCLDKLNVSGYPLNGGLMKADIYNVAGRKFNVPFLHSGKNTAVNTSSLAEGVYFLVVQSAKSKVVKKFVKQ